MFLGKYAVNFRTPFPKTTSAGLLQIFSELLALEIAKSNDVEICQFILIRWNQTCFSHDLIISIYITHLTCDSFSKKNADVTYGFKNNPKIKVIKKVKESCLKIMKGEVKQYQRRWK